jgi:oligogalacturonide transport system substrate-binding protein
MYGFESTKGEHNMTKGKILSLFMALIMLAMPIAASAQSVTTDDITLTFSWWGGDSRHEATQAAVEKFMEKYPNITVETTFGAWSGWAEATGLKLATDTGEDVMQYNWNWISEFAGSGDVLADLSQYPEVLDTTQFPAAALAASELDGKLQGIPISTTARTLYWNGNTFEKAGIETPTTFEGLLAAGKTFKEVLGDEYYPLHLGEYDRMIFMVYYLESMYNKAWVVDGQLNYTKEEIMEGLAMIDQLEDEHVLPLISMVSDYAADPIDQSDRWINGYWAGNYNWNTSFANVLNALPEDQQDGFVIGTMFTDLPYMGGYNKISMLFVIPESSEHKVEAAALINFLLSEKEGVMAMGSQRGVPASAQGLAIASENNIVDEDTLLATKNALDSGWNGFPLDPTFESTALRGNPDGVYSVVFGNLSADQISVEEAADQLIAGINEQLGN